MAEISVEELKSRILSGSPLAVIDLRGASSFADWSIPGSINLPVIESLRRDDPEPLRERTGELPTDRPLVMVCEVGISAGKASRILEPLGFQVTTLAGGMQAWSGVHSEAPLSLPGDPAPTVIQVRRNGKGCLSYFVSSEGSALVIDPSVAISVYEDLASREGSRIEQVLETHVHADHVSRARALARATGATLRIPRNQRVNYPYEPIEDLDTIELGGVSLQAIATPGHTGESTCYRLDDRALFTGDTLFAESIGRPDLERGDAGAPESARILFRTLRDRFRDLPDPIVVLPCHTAAGIPLEDVTPIAARLGDLREGMRAFGEEEESFVEAVLSRLGEKPPCVDRVIAVNEGKLDLGRTDPLEIEAGPNRCAV